MLGPSLHALSREGSRLGLQAAYLQELEERTRRLLAAKVPVIYSLMHLAVLTNSPWSELHRTVAREVDPYSTFEIRKRSGGNRRICMPAPYLRRVQRWIHSHILLSPGALGLIHASSTAYGPDCSALANASLHAGAAWMVKLDIKDFFESISERQVFGVYRALQYPPLIAFELTRLSTRTVRTPWQQHPSSRERRWRWRQGEAAGDMPYAHTGEVGHLPQGAPTSPLLANLVVREMDKRILALAESAGATYTRYADDIVLSLTDCTRARAEGLLREVAAVITHRGFRVNRKKTHVHGPGARKVVTGLVVNAPSPRLPKAVKDEIDLAIYHIQKHGLSGHMERRRSKNPLGYLSHLKGLLIYARNVEPEYAAARLEELQLALKPYAELLDVFRSMRSPPLSPYEFA